MVVLTRRALLLFSVLLLAIGLPLVAYTESVLLLALLLGAVAVVLYAAYTQRPVTPPHPTPAPPSTGGGHLTRDQMVALNQSKAGSDFPVPEEGAVFQGALGLQFPARYQPQAYAHNAYGNPSTFDYDVAVRSGAPALVQPPCTKEDNFLARMYNPVNVIPEDMIMHPLPDPTLSARIPTFADALVCNRNFVAATDPLRIMPRDPTFNP